MTPRFVADILRSTWLWHFSRVLITFMYWYAAIGFIIHFHSAEADITLTGLRPRWLIAGLTIAVELIGSGLIILDRAVWFGAGMLGVFTLLTIPLDHAFWNMTGLAAVQARLESEEHLTVVGGLIIVSILSFLRKEQGQPHRLASLSPSRQEFP
jgi:transmembrane protein